MQTSCNLSIGSPEINVFIKLSSMVSKIIHYVIYCLINIIRIFRLTELYQPTFNPNNIKFARNKLYARESFERIEIIAVHIDLKKISTYLDIGSQLGYFVYKRTLLFEIMKI